MKKSNTPWLMMILTCLLSVLLLCGCWPGADAIGEYEKDISNRQKLWGGYAKGERYILLHDIFLQEKEFPTEMRKYVGVPPRELVRNNCYLHYSAPETITVYLETPERWPAIIGVIEAGTEIESTKILGWGTLMWPMSHTIYATILDGPYAGKSIDIDELSITSWVKIGFGEDYVLYPNWSLLKRANIDEEND